MGKKKGCKNEKFWTKMRIIGREFQKNALQGFIKVRLISGYGYEKYILEKGKSRQQDIVMVLRPSDLIPIVSEDGAIFKKRSVIDMGNDTYMMLDMAESFCILPLLESSEISSSNSISDRDRCVKDRANSRKRKAYAMKKDIRGSRELIDGDTYKSLYRIVLRYKKQMSPEKFLSEFMGDIAKNCDKISSEFSAGGDVSSTPSSQIVPGVQSSSSVPGVQNVSSVEIVPGVQNVPGIQSVQSISDDMSNIDTMRLSNISMSRINW